MKKNIVLIGMPGSGKSTIGVLLAKAINYHFIDGDLLIQRQEGKTLVDIINEKGIDAFLAIENQVLRDINTEASVIATGGSAIFSEEAMNHLGEQGLIVYLDVSCEEIVRRKFRCEWWGNVRFDTAFTPALARLMAKAGCIAVTGGLECANDRLLKLMNKGITLASAEKVLKESLSDADGQSALVDRLVDEVSSSKDLKN